MKFVLYILFILLSTIANTQTNKGRNLLKVANQEFNNLRYAYSIPFYKKFKSIKYNWHKKSQKTGFLDFGSEVAYNTLGLTNFLLNKYQLKKNMRNNAPNSNNDERGALIVLVATPSAARVPQVQVLYRT